MSLIILNVSTGMIFRGLTNSELSILGSRLGEKGGNMYSIIQDPSQPSKIQSKRYHF